jgi:hypothetical protein
MPGLLAGEVALALGLSGAADRRVAVALGVLSPGDRLLGALVGLARRGLGCRLRGRGRLRAGDRVLGGSLGLLGACFGIPCVRLGLALRLGGGLRA